MPSMKRSPSFVAAALFIAAAFGVAGPVRSSEAQGKPGMKSTITKDEALGLEKKFWDTLIADDTAGMAKIMADDSVFIHGNAVADTKSDFIAAMANPVVTGFDREEPTELVFFPGGAIIRGTANVTVNQKGSDGTVQKIVRHQSQSSVFVLTPAGWQMMLMQQTAIGGPGRGRGGPPAQ
jgi:hypothetical protein